MSNPDRWSDVQRIEGWAGEVRVNLIRLAALLVFYGHHLINVYLLHDPAALQPYYHANVTALVLAWAAAVLGLHFCLSRRWVPAALKYVATAWDLVLVTALLVLSGDPKTVFADFYFLVIAASALRLSLLLVQFATVGSMAAYAFFLGYVRFYLQLTDEQRLDRPSQVIVELALGAAGLLAGQVVRQIRRVAVGYPVVVQNGERSDHGA
jgi:hypothetical protein